MPKYAINVSMRGEIAGVVEAKSKEEAREKAWATDFDGFVYIKGPDHEITWIQVARQPAQIRALKDGRE